MSQIIFFSRSFTAAPPALPPIPADCRITLWRPRFAQPVPLGMPGSAALVWSMFHATRVFRNRDYGIVLVHHGDRIVHRSYVFPGYFRFPFLAAADLQVGDTWTDEAWRGRGLAAAALEYAVQTERRPDRTFWYLTHEENVASVRTALRCGFTRRCVGRRTRRFGLRLLGAFEPEQWISPVQPPAVLSGGAGRAT